MKKGTFWAVIRPKPKSAFYRGVPYFRVKVGDETIAAMAVFYRRKDAIAYIGDNKDLGWEIEKVFI